MNSKLSRPAPRGFSLIEILIVMMILGVLIALIATALGPLLGQAKEEETRVTIEKIEKAIEARLDAIKQADALIKSEARRVAAGSSLTAKQAEFIIKKNLYRLAVPQRVEDFYGFDRVSGGGDDATPTGLDTANCDKAEPLYAALVNMTAVEIVPGGKTIQLPTLDLDNFNQVHIADADADDNPSFVDSWGYTLRVYPWPTRLIRPDGPGAVIMNDVAGDNDHYTAATIHFGELPSLAGAQTDTDSDNVPDTLVMSHALNQDPSDPTGRTLSSISSWPVNVNLTGGPSFSIENVNAEANYHSVNTYYSFLIVSSGPDNELGLGEPTDASPNHLALLLDQNTSVDGIQVVVPGSGAIPIADNITNRQQ